MNVVNFMRRFKESPAGAPYVLKKSNPEATSTYQKHFNADLAETSDYFRKLDAFLTCIDKNAANESLSEAQQARVCAKEYKSLRLEAFDNKLMYHHVNKRFFQNEISLQKHESHY